MKIRRWHNGFRGFVLFALSALLISSCASTKLTTTWYDDTYSGTDRLQNVLIIAVTNEETTRRLYEDSFTELLKKNNVHAVQSYTLQDSDIEPTRGGVDDAVAEAGADFVLITRHLSTDTKEHYRPPQRTSVYADPYYGRMHSYYPMAYREVYYTPGYSYNVTTVAIESNLYDVSTEKLIWTAQSLSTDPKMTRKYIDGLAELFAKDLQGKGLVPQ